MAKSMRRLGCILCAALGCAAALICLCALLLLWTRRCSYENGEFAHAAVAADSLKCSHIGRDILSEGGSAVDAAISALLCTSLINPQSMGIGGGAVFTIMTKDGDVSVVNSRETVPTRFPKNLLEKCPLTMDLDIPVTTDWIGVPGELHGYAYAHSKFGKLPWRRLFQPIIKMARDGFPVPQYLGKILNYPKLSRIVKNTSLCQIFCHDNKTILSAGDTLRYPKLADTLEIIAEKGVQEFYTGKIAEDLIHDVTAQGGSLTLEDLRSIQAEESKAVTVPLGDFIMHFPPPPFGGPLLSFILNVMHGFGLSPLSIKGEERTMTLHRYIETLKFANGQKKHIRDPKHVRHRAHHLMDSKFINHIRSMINNSGTYPESYYNVTPSIDQSGTTHVSVIASDGSAVSVTSTINNFFGSSIYSPKTGIILNNELMDFCGKASSISAGEQPPSSMSPVIIHSKNREKVLVIGGSGGSQIITAMATAIMNKLWFGMDLHNAIKDKVVFVDSGNTVKFENGFDQSMQESLMTLRHNVKMNQRLFNVVNGVMKENGCITAVSDGRKYGKASGY